MLFKQKITKVLMIGALVVFGVFGMKYNLVPVANGADQASAYLAADQTYTEFNLNDFSDMALQAFFNDVRENPDNYVYTPGRFLQELRYNPWGFGEVGGWWKIDTGETYIDVNNQGRDYKIDYDKYSTTGSNAGVNKEKFNKTLEKQDKIVEKNKKAVAAAEAAAKDPSMLQRILGSILAWFLYYIAVGLAWIMQLITGVMLKIAVFNNFLGQSSVQIGWAIIRDICNNFFIVFLMILAAATVLGVKEYQWRTMLPKILIYAVVINFSLTICGLAIDASQVLMLTFASPLSNTTGYNIILGAFSLPDAMNLKGVLDTWKGGDGTINPADVGLDYIDIVAALLFAILVTIVAIVVIGCITAILVYRIIMLIFLCILSPLPWLARASNVKQLQSATAEWSTLFSKMLTVGPAMMFFLYISFMTMGAFNNAKTSGSSGSILVDNRVQASLTAGQTGSALAGGNSQVIRSISQMGTYQGFLNFMIVCGLLWVSLMMGQRFGEKAGGIAGKGMNWLNKSAKKFSGFNLAKSVPGRLKKAPGLVGTAVDDKLGLRAGLYRGLYGADGKYVPGLRTAIGGKVGALESGTSKRRQARIGAAATAMGVDRMSQDELRRAANAPGASTDQRMAATQALMKNGWINDDDTANHQNNLDLINAYRKSLPPDLLATFDNTVKRSNPNLALQSSIYNGGKNIDKLTQDIGDGKVKLGDLMKNADAASLDSLRQATGGTNNDLVKWMIKNSKDDKEFGSIMAGLSKEAKDRFAKDMTGAPAGRGIDSSVFQGANPAEQKTMNKMREAYIKSAKDLDFDKMFSTAEQTEKKNFVSANQSWIASEASVGQLDKIMGQVGDMFDPKALEQISGRGLEYKNKLKDVFDGIASGLNEADLNGRAGTAAKERAKKMMENSLVAGAEVDFEKNSMGVSSVARRKVLEEILAGKNKGKVLDNLADSNLNDNFLQSAVKAGLSSADYSRLDPAKLKTGFEALSGKVGGTITDPSEAAKIYEQAMINGAKIDTNHPDQKQAYEAAIGGSRRQDILKNMSHENIDANFINNGGLDSLTSKEISDLGRLSVDHKNNLNTHLTARYRNTSNLLAPGSSQADKTIVRKTISQMAASGIYIDYNTAGIATKEQFHSAAKSFNADTLRNLNYGATPPPAMVKSLAENIPANNLREFLNNPGTKNQPLTVELVNIIKTFGSSSDPKLRKKFKDLQDLF